MRSLISILALLTFSSTVLAQTWGYMPQLKKSDIDLLNKNAVQLLEKGKIGESITWDNEETGTKGSMTLVAKQDKDKRPCGQLSHDIEPAREKAERNIRSWRCKQEDSSWKIENPNS